MESPRATPSESEDMRENFDYLPADWEGEEVNPSTPLPQREGYVVLYLRRRGGKRKRGGDGGEKTGLPVERFVIPLSITWRLLAEKISYRLGVKVIRIVVLRGRESFFISDSSSMAPLLAKMLNRGYWIGVETE